MTAATAAEDTEDDPARKAPRSWLIRYQQLVQKEPYYANAAAGAVLAAMSVITSDYISFYRSSSFSRSSFAWYVSWLEIVVAVTVSATYTTPGLMLFYSYLNDLTSCSTITKLAIDQFLFSPMFLCGRLSYRYYLLDNFLACTWYRATRTIASRVVAVAPLAILSSWLFWIPQRYCALRFVPPIYQLLFGHVCSYVWNIIFSLIVRR